MFKEYQHVERLGTVETDGIEFGKCYIFPKIDGTNGSLWVENEEIKAGSRKRELAFDNDNAGFYNDIIRNENIVKLFLARPDLRLYGEWLVPHSFKKYKETAWRKFYIFDVMDGVGYMNYDEYKPILEAYNIEYIPCIATIENGNTEAFTKALELNNYLVEDGQGIGEGIVIKNYSYRNRFGRITWAKIVTSEFKERHLKEMGAPELKAKIDYNDRFIADFCTEAFIRKEHAKIALEGWTSKMIPKLIGIVFNQLVTENIWEAIKQYKFPELDFGRINKLCIQKIKTVMPELF